MDVVLRNRAVVGLSVLLAGAVLLVAAHPGKADGAVVYGYPLAPKCPAAGFADVVDRFNMDTCNCTSYVAWALWANGQRVDWFIAGAMDARNWPHVARLASLRVGRSPRVGSVAVWPWLVPPFGHVAYVIGLERDGTFDVAEYNFPGAGAGRYAFDTRRHVDREGAVFIYVPRRVS